MNYTQEIVLDVGNCSIYQTIQAKQGDTGSRFVRVALTKNGMPFTIPAGSSARFRCAKPDGNGCDNPATISDNTITVEFTDQVLAVPGSVRADVVLTDQDGSVLSSAVFLILVEAAAVGRNVNSSSEMLTFMGIINDGQALITALRNAWQNGEFKGDKGDRGDTGATGPEGPQGPQGEKGEKGDDYRLTENDKAEIAMEVVAEVAYIQPDEPPADAPENALWVDTDEEMPDTVTSGVLADITSGIRMVDSGLTYTRGVVEIRKIGGVVWVIDSGVYSFTSEFKASRNRTTLEFEIPKELSNKLHNVNGVYGTTGTIGYFPALAYENVTYTTFNCQSYLKRTAIGANADTFQLVYTGLDAVSGGGLCGFHLKMPLILVDAEV